MTISTNELASPFAIVRTCDICNGHLDGSAFRLDNGKGFDVVCVECFCDFVNAKERKIQPVAHA